MTFPQSFHSRLGKELWNGRKKSKLTRSAVGKECGCHSQFIYNIEAGRCGPPTHVLAQLLKLYNLPPEKIVRLALKGYEVFLRKELSQERTDR